MKTTIQFFLLFLSIWLAQAIANTVIHELPSTRRFQQPSSDGIKQTNTARRRRRYRNRHKKFKNIYLLNLHNLFW